MLARCVAFIRALLRRRAIEREVQEELAFHLEQEERFHAARGVPPDEARRLAALALGGVGQTRDAVRDVRTTSIETLWREMLHGARTLWNTPAYTIPTVTVLALGVAGTSAVFSVVDAVLLRPLPYANASELVRVWSRNDERRVAFLSVTVADFEDWRARTTGTTRFGAYERPRVVPFGEGGEPVDVMSVTFDLFDTLGVAPAMGRGFTSGDRAGEVAVISHELWRSEFGGAADVIGRRLSLAELTPTVVGVMPPRFSVPATPADVWLPLDARTAGDARFAHTLRVIARAQTGDRAAAVIARDLEPVAAQLASERPATNRGWSVTVLPLFDVVVSPEFRRALLIVAGAVLFFLAMASLSALGLLLTRASGRERELAVRVALGASRGSLVRLLLLESLVLGIASGAAGLLLANWAVAFLQSAAAATIPRADELALDGRVFAVALAATLLSSLGAGLLPAWRSTRSPHDRLRARNDTTGSHASTRTLDTLVLVEVTCAVLLVVGATLLVRTVINLQQRELGFVADDLTVVTVMWPGAQEGSDGTARTRDAILRVAAIAGVERVAAVSAPPFSGGNSGNVFQIEGQSSGPATMPDADYRVVSPGYLATLGIALREGRDFTADDGRGRGAVIVSETAARRFWPSQDPIGRRLKIGRSDWLTIVGIAGDARYFALDDPSDALRPMLYLPQREMPSTPMMLVVRSSVAPAALATSMRAALAGDGVTRIDTMNGLLREASVSQRFTMTVVSAFAATAVTLAVVALNGLLLFLIAGRTREIGVRVALGARHWDVVRTVAGRALLLVTGGIASGLSASVALGDALRSALFGVSPRDPITYLLVGLGFLLLAVAAGVLPTLRALRVDPVRVIRDGS